MSRRLLSVTCLIAILWLIIVPVLSAQTTTVPPQVAPVFAGNNSVSGTWDPKCVGQTITVTDQNGIVLGAGTVNADGSFTIVLSRPLRVGDVLTFSSSCAHPNLEFYVLAVAPPIPIPETGTLLMLGSGLAGVAGYIGLRLRSRR